MISLKTIARREAFSIAKEASVLEALEQMQRNRGGCVVLVDREKVPAGILTESAVIRLIGRHRPLDTPAFEICAARVISANENRPIDFAFDFLSENRIRRIVLTDDRGRFAGVVMQEDLFDYLEEDVYRIDLKISDVMIPGQKLVTIAKEATAETALMLMQRRGIGSVLVGEAPKAEGIVTEKDMLELAFRHVDLKEKVARHMSAPLVTVTRQEPVTETIARMRQGGFRRIVVVDEQGRCIGMLTDRDILRQIRGNYTRMLRNKIRHSQEIMDMLPEAIIEVYENDGHRIVHWMNRRAKEIIGTLFIDRELHEMFDASDWSAICASLDADAQLVVRKAAVGERLFEISGTASEAGKGRYIKLIFKDVTRHETAKESLRSQIEEEIRKRMEQEYMLMQQSKLATMGEMIGHIAHQWRQPLAQLGGIFMNIEAAAAFGEFDPKDLREKTRRGNMLIKYMSRTIDDFRHFFEPGQSHESFDLRRYIQNALNIIQAALTFHRIAISLKMPEEPLFVSGYPSEFSQVMLNLLANAKDALIERAAEEPRITIEAVERGKTVRVTVADNGGGIEEAHMARIFDPYFTTKEQKKGTGLGLYISRLIIESKIGGTIRAENGTLGAIFVIEIPKKGPFH